MNMLKVNNKQEKANHYTIF